VPSSGALFLLLYQQLPLCVPPTRMIIGCTLLSFWLWRCISPHASYRTLHTPCGMEVQQQQRDISHFRPLQPKEKKHFQHTPRWLFSRQFFPQLSNLGVMKSRDASQLYIYMRPTRFEFIIFFLYSRASKQPLRLHPPSDGFYLLGPGNKFTRAAWWAGN
jgi:hypothetical protein